MDRSCNFEESEKFENARELGMSKTSEVEHYDESHDTSLHESCEQEVEPSSLELDDDILSVEYESFHVAWCQW